VTAMDLAAIVAAVTSLAAVAALTAVVMRALHTLRDLQTLVAQVQDEMLPLLFEAHDAVRSAAEETHRVDGLLDTAEAISARVDGASRAAYVALSRPVIKTAAAATGAQRAARRLRSRPAGDRRR
jgi:hypothetical protein